MKISFPTDANGFLSQQCPSCYQKFKVVFGEGSNEPISVCPYCGFEGHNCWWTQKQVDYMKAIAAETLISKLKKPSSSPKIPPAPIEVDEDFKIFRFSCCNETIKAERYDQLFCIICGKEIDLKVSDSKKIFLSHKGLDKEVVRNFKSTLDVFGYAPWLDEDAMPAGTTLERGILSGMQESCGVVFFITPSFKDEGYLETEINYAISEKRKKGKRFAIIALQFVDSSGNRGEVPELLKQYVWKEPKSNLEALREIIRALPIKAGDVDWREGIEDIVTTPKIKPKTTELSDEAKAILQEAVAGGGQIWHLKFNGGELIQANSKSLMPNDEPRTVASWIGGLEDLTRRRFIEHTGGEMFRVTREGYEAADELT